LKTPALHFSVDRNHFENEAFQKRRGYENCDISLTEFSSNTNPKKTGDTPIANMATMAPKRGFSVATVAKG